MVCNCVSFVQKTHQRTRVHIQTAKKNNCVSVVVTCSFSLFVFCFVCACYLTIVVLYDNGIIVDLYDSIVADGLSYCSIME